MAELVALTALVTMLAALGESSKKKDFIEADIIKKIWKIWNF